MRWKCILCPPFYMSFSDQVTPLWKVSWKWHSSSIKFKRILDLLVDEIHWVHMTLPLGSDAERTFVWWKSKRRQKASHGSALCQGLHRDAIEVFFTYSYCSPLFRFTTSTAAVEARCRGGAPPIRPRSPTWSPSWPTAPRRRSSSARWLSPTAALRSSWALPPSTSPAFWALRTQSTCNPLVIERKLSRCAELDSRLNSVNKFSFLRLFSTSVDAVVIAHYLLYPISHCSLSRICRHHRFLEHRSP